MEELRYPIGRYEKKPSVSPRDVAKWIDEIEALPTDLRAAVSGLTDDQIDTPYRDGGWTVRQLIHHIADSHLNAYIRFKLGLTEDTPSIKPYQQDDWAKLPDSEMPIAVSLDMLESIHKRWVTVLKSMDGEQLNREIYHPEYDKIIVLKSFIGNYAWHGKHHLAHITNLKKRKDWN